MNATSDEQMTASPTRTAALIANLSSVSKRISAASTRYNNNISASNSSKANDDEHNLNPVRLVAVSKLKPASDILPLYKPPTSHRHFGENYVQELVEKSKILPAEIKWHFIGGLQSNKCVTLAREVRGLWAVESVDTQKKASLLDKGWRERLELTTQNGDSNTTADDSQRHLRVYVQVNTSGEESKSGVEPGAPAVDLCRFIRDKCPHLKLQGVMTIGAIARSKETTPETENEDFVCLRDTRDLIEKTLALTGTEQLELSMGMSEDFEGAIAMGSNQVRVGSTIFGARPPKGENKVGSV
ncbi:hypothetical protein FQN57_006619 [Myotisia sp. PD_48]|nr:hypothetical protein FQN57_006619 [Myotisia sp. PD_48]